MDRYKPFELWILWSVLDLFVAAALNTLMGTSTGVAAFLAMQALFLVVLTALLSVPFRMWLIVSVVTTGLGYYAYGATGAWLTAGFGQIAFWSGMAAVSQYIFPVHFWERPAAFAVLVSWFLKMNRASYVVKEAKVHRRVEPGWMRMGPAAMLIDSGSAVVLERMRRLAAVRGPGTWFLGPGEHPAGAVDLRPQIRRRAPVTATTRDGIAVETRVMMMLEVRALPQPVEGRYPKQPYDWSEETVHWVVYYKPVSHDEDADWTERLLSIAADELRHVLARYKLDDIFRPEDYQRGDAMPEIKTQMREAARREFQRLGINVQVDVIGAATPRPPLAVTEQRIRSWQMPWAGRAMEAQARGEAAALGHVERARAHAQHEMIRKLLGTFNDVGPQMPAQLIRIRFVTALERMLAERGTRELLPNEVVDELRRFIRLPEEERPHRAQDTDSAPQLPDGARR